MGDARQTTAEIARRVVRAIARAVGAVRAACKGRRRYLQMEPMLHSNDGSSLPMKAKRRSPGLLVRPCSTVTSEVK